MKVWIDQDCCTGAGLCVDHCPDLFIVLEDGIGYVRNTRARSPIRSTGASTSRHVTSSRPSTLSSDARASASTSCPTAPPCRRPPGPTRATSSTPSRGSLKHSPVVCSRPCDIVGHVVEDVNVRAVVYDRYGSPDVLRVEDVPIPTPAARQVLVRVAATSVNLSDWECLRGTPLYSAYRWPPLTGESDTRVGHRRLGRGRRRGRDSVPRPGDEVYGDNLALKGGFAEYALAPESDARRKPAELTFAEASTIPQAGPIALQGIDGAAAGRRVLINGGGGGSGSFAIQVAKRTGAHVTAVDNAGKLDHMRSLGADVVIDYRTEDFTRSEQPYDLVLDLVAHRSVFAYRRALAPGVAIDVSADRRGRWCAW